MTTTRSSLVARHKEVEAVIRWYLKEYPRRLLDVKRRGQSVEDFIQSVWERLLFAFRDDGHSANATLSTVVYKTCGWEIARFVPVRNINTMRRVRLRDVHVVYDEDLSDVRGLWKLLADLLCELDKRHAIVLRYRYGILGVPELKLSDLGKALKVTRERIRQMEMKALYILMNPKQSLRLLEFIQPRDSRIRCRVTTLSGTPLGELRLPSRGYQNYLAFAHPRDGISFRELLHDVGGADFTPAEDAPPVLLSDRVKLATFVEPDYLP